MSEIDGKKNCLNEISEMLAEQNSSYMNFSQRLKVAEIRTRQIGLDADLIKSEIQSVRVSLERLINPLVEGLDVRKIE